MNMVEQSGDSVDPTGFQVANHQVDQAVVLSVAGEVDMLSAPRLAEAIHTALAASPAALIVDLSKVDFLASAGMTVLLTAQDEVVPPTRFAVVAHGAATSRPIQLTRLDSVLPLYSTLDNALESVAGG
jgi:anti-sigma B factor antagonist